jgi:hypothetical protein
MADPTQTQEPLENPQIKFEQSDANTGRAALWAGAVLILVFVAMLMTFILLGGLSQYRAAIEPTPLPLTDSRPTPPPPRLQPNPVDQLTAEEELIILRVEEEYILNSYGWVNEQAGIVRIPIERAMQLLAVDELPADEPAR